MLFRSVPAADRRHQAVTVTVEPGFDLTLIRETPSLRALLLRPVSLLAFGAFWGFSLALAWVMARRFLATARLAVLGKMAASLAHEIHNPVAAIRLHAQLGEPAALPLIRAEADRIESLVNQWQFLAKPTPPATSPVDLHDVVATVATALAAQAEHARVTIATNVPVGSLVRADRRRLEQALRNIAWNAIQAMPGGGKLTFEYRDGRLGVLDTGRGFSPTALARGTELFFSEREGGMGIGLSVAHEIIRAHGGALTLENSPTGGASVWLKLPPAS